MTNYKKTMRKAKAIVKIISNARKALANPPKESPYIRMARAIVGR